MKKANCVGFFGLVVVVVVAVYGSLFGNYHFNENEVAANIIRNNEGLLCKDRVIRGIFFPSRIFFQTGNPKEVVVAKVYTNIFNGVTEISIEM